MRIKYVFYSLISIINRRAESGRVRERAFGEIFEELWGRTVVFPIWPAVEISKKFHRLEKFFILVADSAPLLIA